MDWTPAFAGVTDLIRPSLVISGLTAIGLTGLGAYLPKNNAFNVHKENNTTNTAVPIDATSAIIAISFSRMV
jgi:hypothetical protein